MSHRHSGKHAQIDYRNYEETETMKKQKQPLISVIMPVHNAAEFLVPAIQSILRQDYRNFELVIVDDASTDSSWQIISKFRTKFPKRIKAIRLRKNRNLGGDAAGNIAFQHTNPESTFIARMDADDIAYPHRLSTQVAYLLTHPQIAILGSAVEVINQDSVIIGQKTAPLTPQALYDAFFRISPMIHPTVMIRRSALPDPKNLYSLKLSANNDYYTFATLASRGVQFANLPEKLLQYRIHTNNDSISNLKRTFFNTLRVRYEMLTTFHYRPNLLSSCILLAQLATVTFIPEKVLLWLYLTLRGFANSTPTASTAPALTANKTTRAFRRPKKLVMVIPTYNERGNIEPLLFALHAAVKQLPKQWQLHTLFVDDNSPDGTAAEIERVQQLLPHRSLNGLSKHKVHLYHNPEKGGLGKAYLVGMDYALSELKADALGQFDADLSHDPQKIPALLTKIDQGYSMVIGSRYIAGGSIPANWGWQRKLMSSAGNLLVRYGLGHPEIHDWSTGFRIMKRSAYQKIRPLISEEQFFGYLIMIGIVHTSIKSKLSIAEVPFDFVDRKYGESKLGIEYIFWTISYIVVQRVSKVLADVTGYFSHFFENSGTVIEDQNVKELSS